MKLSVIALLMCVYITASLAEVKKKSKNDYSAQKKSLLNQLLKKELNQLLKKGWEGTGHERKFVCHGDESTVRFHGGDLGCWDAIQQHGAGSICGGYPDSVKESAAQCCGSCAHLCSDTDCGSHGHCVVGGSGGECSCDEGWTGYWCNVCDEAQGFKYNDKSLQCEAPCRDKSNHCPEIAADGLCEEMKDMCRKSCGVCEVRCENIDPLCHESIPDEYCEKYSYLQHECRKSCGLCEACENKHPKCPEMAADGLCKSDPEVRNHMCRKSCGVCED